ncbi:hypothetical protein [Bradyrhizobium sp. Cp5.3]|uniref:hypothetical protein n=1 Tax=Bradyrhizobium sp. Cp5.3 TaxID=443598 RepID=UPI000413B456|nr:hypothetical protein [Bradyrhizobium sp. Cp5.3]
MSAKNDPSQGLGPARPRPQSVPTKRPVPMAQGDQAALNAKDKALTTPRPPQKVTGKTDWRRG